MWCGKCDDIHMYKYVDVDKITVFFFSINLVVFDALNIKAVNEINICKLYILKDFAWLYFIIHLRIFTYC